jgi:hypothetical protein
MKHWDVLYRIIPLGPVKMKNSNSQTIPAFQSIFLRTVAKALWYVQNKSLHYNLLIKTFNEMVITLRFK